MLQPVFLRRGLGYKQGVVEEAVKSIDLSLLGLTLPRCGADAWASEKLMERLSWYLLGYVSG